MSALLRQVFHEGCPQQLVVVILTATAIFLRYEPMVLYLFPSQFTPVIPSKSFRSHVPPEIEGNPSNVMFHDKDCHYAQPTTLTPKPPSFVIATMYYRLLLVQPLVSIKRRFLPPIGRFTANYAALIWTPQLTHTNWNQLKTTQNVISCV